MVFDALDDLGDCARVYPVNYWRDEVFAELRRGGFDASMIPRADTCIYGVPDAMAHEITRANPSFAAFLRFDGIGT